MYQPLRLRLPTVMLAGPCACTPSVETGDPEAIDVYLCEQDAQRALEDCLRDEAAVVRATECHRGRTVS